MKRINRALPSVSHKSFLNQKPSPKFGHQPAFTRPGNASEGDERMIAGSAEWHVSPSVCALNDRERHLGHLINVNGNWIAFDGTRPDEWSSGFRRIGIFDQLQAAMTALEETALVPFAEPVSALIH
ncbi:MAG TPA: hypothetical protein VNH18_05970 [Bryobacteraceae bacterium]|nr:hypothetical protein [Bryobacteraceae bacterium]